MRWKGRRESTNIEDRRGMGRGGLAVGGGLGTIAILVLAAFCGVDPSRLLEGGGQAPGTQVERRVNPEEEELAQFTRVVLADTEDVWNEKLPQQARVQYRQPTLVFFTGQVDSACGRATAQVGPFYCPGDQKIYIDLSFYRELKSKLGAPGDFAQAYVIAHEVGHHIQNVLGTMERSRRGGTGETEEQQSVRVELQADCYSGVWAKDIGQKGFVEVGDIEEATNAAEQIGDDRLQKQSQGYVVPDSFTHGSSEQRARWFRRGYESGDMRQCETFNIPYRSL